MTKRAELNEVWKEFPLALYVLKCVFVLFSEHHLLEMLMHVFEAQSISLSQVLQAVVSTDFVTLLIFLSARHWDRTSGPSRDRNPKTWHGGDFCPCQRDH